MKNDPAVLIGQRIRAIRTSGDVTTTKVADAMRARGLPWNAGRVSKLESGGLTITAAQLAHAASHHGLPWSDSRVSALERGKVALTPGVLYIIAGVFAELLDRDVTIADLIPDETQFELTPILTVSSEQLAGALRGEPVRLPPAGIDIDNLGRAVVKKDRDAIASFLPDLTRVDLAVIDAASPDDQVTGLDACVRLWGVPPEMMRDCRAPEGANAQKLGRITRELIAELTEALETKPWLHRKSAETNE